MSRSTAWRRVCPDVLLTRISQASEARLYLLRNTGPTGFLLKEEECDKEFKVLLGDPHSCTCAVFLKEKELCIHLLWVIIKKFRVPKDSQVCFQLGLIEREINEVINGLSRHVAKVVTTVQSAGDERGKLMPKAIGPEDVCPICQDTLYKCKEPLTYCRFGCGNSAHFKCLKIWADHQHKSNADVLIKCPLCRLEYGTYETIIQEFHRALAKFKREKESSIHTGSQCRRCRVQPIKGRIFRCSQCSDYVLCDSCFSVPFHAEHDFQFRASTTQRWRPAMRTTSSKSSILSLSGKPSADTRKEMNGLDLDLSIKSLSLPTGRQSDIQRVPTMKKMTRLRKGAGSQPNLPSLAFEVSGIRVSNAASTAESELVPRDLTLPPLYPSPQVDARDHATSAHTKKELWSRKESLPVKPPSIRHPPRRGLLTDQRKRSCLTASCALSANDYLVVSTVKVDLIDDA